jgi:pSer/pThr/pTyr-binding forkhead associated (FHA) protein
VVVEDLGSRNGVRVDGDRVEGQQLVVGNHRIHVGERELLLEHLEAAPRASFIRDKKTAPEPYAAVSDANGDAEIG